MKPIALFAAVVVLAFSSLSAAAQAAPAATPVIVPTVITPTYIDPNGKVPVLNGVPGAGVINLDLGFPVGVLVHGNSYIYVLALTDVSFTGTCTLSYKLTQVQGGVPVTLDSNSMNRSQSPGVWAWVFPGKAIPNSPGIATLTGTVKCGTASASIHTNVLLQ